MVSWPDSPVRGAVVLCPPIGYEATCAHATFRLLAEQLAPRGLVAMRIDYDGSGNSMGDETDPARVEGWRRTVTDAVREVRGFGAPWVGLVGLRFGATLAVLAGTRPDDEVGAGVDAFALWDPVVSGRRYSRELRVLGVAPRDGDAGDGIVVAGLELTAATLTEISAVTIALDELAAPTLVIRRPERTSASDGPSEEWPGTTEMLDTDVELSAIPHAIVDRLVDWFDDMAPAPTGPAGPEPAFAGTATETIGDVELHHAATSVGDAQIFTVRTQRLGPSSSPGPGPGPDAAIVLLNNGLAPQIGPGRAWVEFARRWAEDGWTVVRMDLTGIGDSPARPGHPSGDSYPVTAGADVTSVLDDLRSAGMHRFAIAGLCSGALLAYDAALMAPDVAVVASVNPRFDHPLTVQRGSRRTRAGRTTRRLAAVPLRKTPLLPWFERVPAAVWRAFDLVRLVPLPSRGLRRVRAQGTAVVLVFGPHEWGLRALHRRDGAWFDRFARSDAVEVHIIDDLDHSMFSRAARAEAREVLTAALSRYLPPGNVRPSTGNVGHGVSAGTGSPP